MREGTIGPADERGLHRLDAEVLASMLPAYKAVMEAQGTSLTEIVRRTISVRHAVDGFAREGARLSLWEVTGERRELRTPNVSPEADEQTGRISCNLNTETAETLEQMRQDDGTPLGETLRRALALYVEVARNQEMGGRIEAHRADGQELHVVLL